jgi:hypothetical protein
MAHLLRGKQTGIQKDLSAGVTPEFFAIDNVRRPSSAYYAYLLPAPANTLGYSSPVMALILRYPH